jgi:PTH1 family peptidyl-tRNA hydrolase
MKIITGLGNPGKEYELTRHNIGFLAIEHIADNYSIFFDKKIGKALYGKGMINNETVIVLKPQTYMNLSGNAVLDIKTYYKVENEDIIVIHDDIDLLYGVTRIRRSGSHGGHNGIRNIISVLNTENFVRVKAGIGRPENPNIPIDRYVLSAFNENERNNLNDFIKIISSAAVKIITSGINEAMGEFNRTNSQ